jgi:hypothetical protein
MRSRERTHWSQSLIVTHSRQIVGAIPFPMLLAHIRNFSASACDSQLMRFLLCCSSFCPFAEAPLGADFISAAVAGIGGCQRLESLHHLFSRRSNRSARGNEFEMAIWDQSVRMIYSVPRSRKKLGGVSGREISR